MWKKLMRNVDLDEPTSFLDHVKLRCTQRECKPHEIILEEYTKMFESRISAGATEKLPEREKPSRNNNRVVLRHGTACSNMRKELLRVDKQQRGAALQSFKSLDDYQFEQEELASVGELSKSMLTNCLTNVCTWQELGDQTFCGLSTNLQKQSENGIRHATDDWQDWFHTFITQMNSGNIVMWVTRLSMVRWVYSKTQTLLAILGTRNQPLGESYVSLEAEHLSPPVGCARKKRQYPTVLQSLKSFLWMDCAWVDCPLSIFGTW